MRDSDLASVVYAEGGPPSGLRSLVQSRAEDVVLAAALFKPNAVGSYELTTGDGFGQRQLLKARGAYLGERVVLGMTPLHLHVLLVFVNGRIARSVPRWPRTQVSIDLVAPRADAHGVWRPALLLRNDELLRRAELQVMTDDDDARLLIRLLMGRDEARE